MMILLTSCSKNEEDEVSIVGEWILIEFIQNDVQLETDICWEGIALIFTESHSVYSEVLDEAPAECDYGISEFQLWTNVGNNSYEISSGNDLISNVRIENDILIMTYQNGSNWTTRHRRR
ncbi:MAG: hypothetical protein ACSHXF_06455 [Aquaticitalea sp.]